MLGTLEVEPTKSIGSCAGVYCSGITRSITWDECAGQRDVILTDRTGIGALVNNIMHICTRTYIHIYARMYTNMCMHIHYIYIYVYDGSPC